MHYKLQLGTSHDLAHGIHIIMDPQIYIGWERDTICLMPTLVATKAWHEPMLRTPRLSKIALNVFHEISNSIFKNPPIKEVILYSTTCTLRSRKMDSRSTKSIRHRI